MSTQGSKSYRAQAVLGTETDTLDSTGKIIETIDSTHITYAALEAALPAFRGNITQIPPMYSALKKNGKRLYELARKGEIVERAARPVTIYSLDMVELESSQEKLNDDGKREGIFGLDVNCSGGTYIRTLISDLARACGGRAHMTGLCRTKQGPYVLGYSES